MLNGIYHRTVAMCANIQENLPSRFQLIQKIQKMVLPIIGLMSIANLQQAEGGPISFAACLATCEAGAVGATVATAGVAAPAVASCWAICLPFLTLPAP